MFTINVDVTTT